MDPMVSVAESFDVVGNSWMPRLHRNLNDWKMGELCSLLGLIECWKPKIASDFLNRNLSKKKGIKEELENQKGIDGEENPKKKEEKLGF